MPTLYWHDLNATGDANDRTNYSTDQAGTVAAGAGALTGDALRFNGTGAGADNNWTMSADLTCQTIVIPDNTYTGAFSIGGFRLTLTDTTAASFNDVTSFGPAGSKLRISGAKAVTFDNPSDGAVSLPELEFDANIRLEETTKIYGRMLCPGITFVSNVTVTLDRSVRLFVHGDPGPIWSAPSGGTIQSEDDDFVDVTYAAVTQNFPDVITFVSAPTGDDLWLAFANGEQANGGTNCDYDIPALTNRKHSIYYATDWPGTDFTGRTTKIRHLGGITMDRGTGFAYKYHPNFGSFIAAGDTLEVYFAAGSTLDLTGDMFVTTPPDATTTVRWNAGDVALTVTVDDGILGNDLGATDGTLEWCWGSGTWTLKDSCQCNGISQSFPSTATISIAYDNADATTAIIGPGVAAAPGTGQLPPISIDYVGTGKQVTLAGSYAAVLGLDLTNLRSRIGDFPDLHVYGDISIGDLWNSGSPLGSADNKNLTVHTDNGAVTVDWGTLVFQVGDLTVDSTNDCDFQGDPEIGVFSFAAGRTAGATELNAQHATRTATWKMIESGGQTAQRSWDFRNGGTATLTATNINFTFIDIPNDPRPEIRNDNGQTFDGDWYFSQAQLDTWEDFTLTGTFTIDNGQYDIRGGFPTFNNVVQNDGRFDFNRRSLACTNDFRLLGGTVEDLRDGLTITCVNFEARINIQGASTWFLNASGTAKATNGAIVANSDASGSAAPADGTDALSGGGNTNWLFGAGGSLKPRDTPSLGPGLGLGVSPGRNYSAASS